MDDKAAEGADDVTGGDRTETTAAAPVVASQSYGVDVLPPLNAIVELAAIVAVFLLLDWLWPSLDINNFQPSVYWLPVLLLTLQYGTVSGSIAVIVAIVATFALGTLPEQGVGENEFTYRLRVLAQPILWIGTAVLLGQFRMVQIAAKRELLERVAELEEQGRTVAHYATSLRSRCDALEREIVAGRPVAGAGLLSALARLEASSSAPDPIVRECLSAAVPGGTVSLYVRTPAGLRRSVSTAGLEEGRWLELVPPGHALHSAIMDDKRSPSVLDEAGEKALGGEGLAAVPVIDPGSGRVVGMIKVEAAPAYLVSAGVIQGLGYLARVLAPRLGAAQSPAATAPIVLRPLAEKMEAQPAVSRPAADGDIAREAVGFRPKAGQ